nr:hypothetical protein Iba_chr02dCG3640 [Ipomoea batatas]
MPSRETSDASQASSAQFEGFQTDWSSGDLASKDIAPCSRTAAARDSPSELMSLHRRNCRSKQEEGGRSSKLSSSLLEDVDLHRRRSKLAHRR